MSHSPLMGFTEPAPGARARVEAALASARAFVRDFAPDLCVVVAPDHYNGFFYDCMPPFCVGTAAHAIGDYDTPAGVLSVDRSAALAIARGVLDADVDIAISETMAVDHGFAQPLQLLFGGLEHIPVVPIFVNCVAAPLGPARRARILGDAVGRAIETLGRRVVIVGSGGLSHDPPMPVLETATDDVAAVLRGGGRTRTREQRDARERRTIQAGRDSAAGDPHIQPLNAEWDRELLAVLASGELERVDAWSTAWFEEQGGHSAHETRTSIAAYAALASTGAYRVTSSFYEAIPHWLAGFAITTALPTPEVT